MSVVGLPARRMHPRYASTSRSTHSAWADTIAAHVDATIPHVPPQLAPRLHMLWASRLTEASQASVLSKLRQFLSFCTAYTLCPVPCASSTLYLYICHLSQRGTIRADYISQYVSAVCTAHRQLCVQAPPVDDVCTGLLQAAVRVQQPCTTSCTRLPLPAHVVTRAVGLALADHNVVNIRVCVFVCFKFVCGVRGSSMLALWWEHVHWDGNTLTVSWVAEKQRARTVAARTVSLQFPRAPALVRLWHLYAQLAGSPSHGSVWSVPHMPHLGSVKRVFDQFLCYTHTHAPTHGKYSGHSTRSGFAATCRAFMVPLEHICSIGGWSLTSASVFKYLLHMLTPDLAGLQLVAGLLNPLALNMATQEFGSQCC